MSLKQQIATLIPLAIIVAGLLTYNFMSAQWQAPTATAPNNNAEAPINISANYQAKLGDLGAVRMRAGEYCNADGTVCTSDVSGGGGGGDDTITVGGQCFEPAWAVTCNWNWSGDGNDDSTYIIPFYLNPQTDGCRTSSRVYQRHTMILAECSASGPVTYSWSTSAWTACYAAQTCTTSGSQSRTVTCQDSNGYTAPDSSCSGIKPTASQSCVAPRRGSDC